MRDLASKSLLITSTLQHRDRIPLAVLALVGATIAGVWIIRRQLAPLSRVSAAAREVADLELDKGEVRLPTLIVRVDPAGRHTEIGEHMPDDRLMR